MHTELFKKDRTDILKYLQSLGEDRKIYSAHRDSIRPLFPDMDGYIYATEEEIILVLMDPGTHKRFDQKDDMAWDLALTCELYRNRLHRPGANWGRCHGRWRKVPTHRAWSSSTRLLPNGYTRFCCR